MRQADGLIEAARAAMAAGAERLASAIREAAGEAGGAEVSVTVDDEGVLVSVAGRGLAAREFGTAGRAPSPVIAPIVDDMAAGIVAGVAAAVGEAW